MTFGRDATAIEELMGPQVFRDHEDHTSCRHSPTTTETGSNSAYSMDSRIQGEGRWKAETPLSGSGAVRRSAPIADEKGCTFDTGFILGFSAIARLKVCTLSL